MGCPCETRTSTCRSFATISSGLYRFLAITVLLDVKDIPQVGPLQWGRITGVAVKLIRHPALRHLSAAPTAQRRPHRVSRLLRAQVQSFDLSQRFWCRGLWGPWLQRANF